MASVLITQRALHKIRKIKNFSSETWGDKVADEYQRTITEAIQLISQNPGLLRENNNLVGHFKFYRVRQYFLICKNYKNNVYLVDIIHTSMDLLDRLTELEPEMSHEIEAIHQLIVKNQKRRS